MGKQNIQTKEVYWIETNAGKDRDKIFAVKAQIWECEVCQITPKKCTSVRAARTVRSFFLVQIE